MLGEERGLREKQGSLLSGRLPFSRELWQKLLSGAGEGRPS